MIKTTHKFDIKRIVLYVFLTLYGVVNLYPLFWVFLSSFKNNNEISANPLGLPDIWRVENYAIAWSKANMGLYFFNSILITLITVVFSVLISSMAAYVIAKVKFKFSFLIFSIFAVGYMVPGQAVLLPVFITIKNLGILNSYFSLIIPYVTFNLAFNIILITGFMKSIPTEIIDSAVVDGCSMSRTFFSIILPLSKTALATSAVLNFLWAWNDYLYALVFMTKPKMMTISLGLAFFRTENTTYYGLLSAGVCMAVIPVLILFIIMRQQVVKGLTAGAIKG